MLIHADRWKSLLGRYEQKRPRRMLVLDGGVTPHNNPAFLLYRMATEPAYRLNWKTGEDHGTAQAAMARVIPNT